MADLPAQPTPATTEQTNIAANRAGHTAARPSDFRTFVAYAYSRKGQKLTIDKPLAKSIAETASIDDSASDWLPALCETDVLFAVPKEIIVAAYTHRHITRLWLGLCDVCRTAFKWHPVATAVAPLLDSDTSDAPWFDALLASLKHSNWSLPIGTHKPLSNQKAAILRANIINTVAFWFVAVRNLDSDLVIRSLVENVWTSETHAASSIDSKWRRLLGAPDPSVLGIVGHVLSAESDRLRHEARTALARERAALERFQLLEVRLEERALELRHQQDLIADLRRQFSNLEATHRTTVSHLRDDYERLRTRVVRRLSREIELLNEGMLAINRSPPKLHVALDHGERVVAGLREELQALENEVHHEHRGI